MDHQKQREFLKNKLESGQLSHAYLFSGPCGIGKKKFAVEFAELAGCKFPDLLVVKPEDGKEIPIAKIREVQNFLSYKSYNGGLKMVIVDCSENMNQEAQNSFLKTLEEPKGDTVLLLISSKPDLLLPTIVSRCQVVKFFTPKNWQAEPEQQKKEQEILKGLLAVARANYADKFKYVKSIDFEKQSAAEIVQVLQKYLRQELLSKIGTKEAEKLQNNLKLAEEINNKLKFTNANEKLALEILLMEL